MKDFKGLLEDQAHHSPLTAVMRVIKGNLKCFWQPSPCHQVRLVAKCSGLSTKHLRKIFCLILGIFINCFNHWTKTSLEHFCQLMLLMFSCHSFLKNFAQERGSKIQILNVLARVQPFIFKHLLDYCMFHSAWSISFTEIILHNDLLVVFLAKTHNARGQTSRKSWSGSSVICLKWRPLYFHLSEDKPKSME